VLAVGGKGSLRDQVSIMADNLERLTREQLVAELQRLQATGLGRSAPDSPDDTTPAGPTLPRGRRPEAFTVAGATARTEISPLEQSPVAHLILGAAGQIESGNTAAAELLGIPRPQLEGRSFVSFVAPADAELFIDQLRRCERRTGFRVDLHLARPDECMEPVQLIGHPVDTVDASGHRRWSCPTAIISMSERDRALQECRASEERLMLATSSAGVGTWELDLGSHRCSWSSEHFRLLGLEEGTIEPGVEAWRSRLHPDDLQRITLARLCRDDLTVIDVEYRVIHSDGSVRWLASRGKVLRDEPGRRHRMIGVTIDITDLKEQHRRAEELNEALLSQSREARRQAVQLRALATQLTQAENRERRRLALLLHDHLQQLLIACRMKVGLIRRHIGAEPAATLLGQAIELIDEAVRASRSLSVELSPPMLYESGLTATLEWLAEQMKDKHGLDVTIEATDEPEDEDIRVFLFQCVRELLFNIVKHARTPTARVRMERLDSDHIVVRVTDAGIGFDVAGLKERWSAGGSFGLYSIHERLNLLGGQLSISSAPGRGTESVLIAPVRKKHFEDAERLMRSWLAAPGREKDASGPPRPPGGPPINVMLVDTHAMLREALTGLLESEPDIRVLAQTEACSEAVRTVAGLPIDIVVLNAGLPHLDPAEVTRNLLAARPGLPIIGLSLRERPDLAERLRSAGAVAFFRTSDLSGRLVEVIRQHARGQRASDPQGLRPGS
jgi:PAS domain S-box-containing protein